MGTGPKVARFEADFARERGQIRTVLDLHRHGWVRSCHDTGQGGMLTALAEMAIGGNGAGRLGLAIDLDEFDATGLPPEKVLFSETGCFIVELPPGNERELLAICARNRVKLHKLGTLKASPKLEAVANGKAIASWDLGELEDIYMTGCRSIFGIEKGE